MDTDSTCRGYICAYVLTALVICLPDVVHPILDVSVWREDILAVASNFQMAPDTTGRWLRLGLLVSQRESGRGDRPTRPSNCCLFVLTT